LCRTEGAVLAKAATNGKKSNRVHLSFGLIAIIDRDDLNVESVLKTV
jgi:hypothetical protein